MSDTTDAAAGGSGPVFRLIYRSHSLIAEDELRSELGQIFAAARRNNRGSEITGALMVSGDAFAQALEGDEAAVRQLLITISHDSRHDELSVLDEHVVAERAFGRWAMARVAEDGGADIRLMSNPKKGVIVAAPTTDAGTTPAQETVLAFMRSSIAPDTPEK